MYRNNMYGARDAAQMAASTCLDDLNWDSRIRDNKAFKPVQVALREFNQGIDKIIELDNPRSDKLNALNNYIIFWHDKLKTMHQGLPSTSTYSKPHPYEGYSAGLSQNLNVLLETLKSNFDFSKDKLKQIKQIQQLSNSCLEILNKDATAEGKLLSLKLAEFNVEAKKLVEGKSVKDPIQLVTNLQTELAAIKSDNQNLMAIAQGISKTISATILTEQLPTSSANQTEMPSQDSPRMIK